MVEIIELIHFGKIAENGFAEIEVNVHFKNEDKTFNNLKAFIDTGANRSGINEKYLSIRAFTPAIKQKVYEKQKGICVHCKEHFELEEMEADHITPWHEGGKTSEENCQLLCKNCNRTKSGK